MEEAPTDEVDTTAVLTTEFLRTLYVCDLLEKLVSRTEVSKLEISKTCTAAYLVDVSDSLSCRAFNLIDTLGSTEKHVRVTHETEVDTAVETYNDSVAYVLAGICPLCRRETAVCSVGDRSLCHRSLVEHILTRVVSAWIAGVLTTCIDVILWLV